MATFVLKRLADGYYYKNGKKPDSWRMRNMSPDQVKARLDAVHWTPDLQAARTYTNRGGAKSALPYKASDADYAFIEVELIIKTGHC